jgi:subtilisin-like proprotein convertase family protein
VIAVGASTNQGVQSYYSEIGANVMVNAPSNGGTAGIVTTDLLGSSGYNAGAGSQPADTDCNNSFGGTSSAAPLVAGITGLILEANPNLTWRDVQHILIDSAEKNDPSGTGVKTWATNAAGYDINYAYGFGRVDAGAAVALADTWTNVPAQTTPFNSGVLTANVAIPDGTGNPGQGAVISRTVNVPQNFIVEHVEVVLDIDHTKRGEVIAAITSPSGTSSTLLFPRVNDTGDNYDNWKTSSLRTWGESSQGTWTLSVADYYAGTTGTLASWQLIIYGYPAGGVTPTNTPGGPTSTPTSTPTVTPTELPGGAVELVQNGGFEEVDGAGEPVLAPWEVKNSTGDKIKCNKEDKVFANSGTCAFRFKGGPDEASAIQQNLDLTDIVPQAGDTVDFSWAMNVPAGSVGKSKIVIKYSDGTEPIKASADWEETVGYENWGTTASVVLDSGNIDKIKFSASNKSVSGKVYFDDISVIYTPAEETLLGLPGFSTSATGKNAVSIGPR